MSSAQIYGVVDVGSNTFNLLLAKFSQGQLEILAQDRRPVMLGKGSHEKGLILPEAEARAIQALEEFLDLAQNYGPTKWKGVATAALRYAKNGAEVAQRLSQTSGIPIQVISGELEAEFIFKGVQAHLNFGSETGLIMDVGGASTEFIAFNGNGLLGLWSFPIGATRLQEVLALHDPLLPQQVSSTFAWLQNQLQPMLTVLQNHRPHFLVGSSGFFDTLVQMQAFRNQGQPLLNYSYHSLSAETLQYWTDRLIPSSLADRLAIPGMLEFRAPMFLASILQVHFVLDVLQIPTAHCTRISLKEGVLADWISSELP